MDSKERIYTTGNEGASMTKEALKLALEALECKDGWGSSVRVLKERAVTSLRTAMSSPKIKGDLMQRFYEGEEAKSLISEAEEAITALREALYASLAEQPAQVAEPRKQEPVAWITKTGSVWKTKADETDTPLYTTPPQRTWVGLTDDEIKEIHHLSFGKDIAIATGLTEAKLKEKNT